MDANSFYETYINAGPSDLASRGYILQETVRQHPWFSLARLLLFKSLCGLGGEAYLSESERTAAYVYSRSQLFNILEEAKKQKVYAILSQTKIAYPLFFATLKLGNLWRF